MMTETIANLIKNLEKNNMNAEFYSTKEEVLARVKELLPEGCSCASGGSMSLKECGITDLLRSGKYQFLDRSAPGLSPEERDQLTAASHSVQYYLCSTNALIADGTLYNVDGFANRVSALANGPEKVILVVGLNKLVANAEEAIRRVKTIAAPQNCRRLSCDTYCAKAGQCVSLNKENPSMTDGCDSPSRICCTYLFTGKQRAKGRITLLLCEENLGF